MEIGKSRVILTALTLVAAFTATASAGAETTKRLPLEPPAKVETCADLVLPPQGKAAGWDVDMAPDVDRRNYGGTVVAYQIQWFDGTWSGWYSKDQNDVDWKVNEDTGAKRRVWSYFTDHQHRVMLCR